MTGRLETKIKTENKIILKLENANSNLQEYYYYMDAEGKSHKTKKLYIDYILSFLKNIDKTENEITSLDVNKYISSLAKGEKPQSCLATLWYALKGYFTFLYNKELIDVNIMKACPKPKRKPSNEVNRTFLNTEEIEILINNVKNGVGNSRAKARQSTYVERDLAIIMVFIHTGIRLTALTEINIDDVDLENNSIKITDKRNKTSNYYMSDTLRMYISDWLIKREELIRDTNVKALFISNQSSRMSINAVSKLVKKYTNGIKEKPLSPHKLRASFATNLYNATGDIQLVQQAMNHSNVSTTQLYVQSSDRNKQKAAEVMENLFSF